MLTFLHVEDNEDDANFFAIAVQCVCGEALVRRVSHGGYAIEYLEGNGVYVDRTQYPFPDLVILDLKMPLVDGLQFLRWRDGSPFASLPVAILTGVVEPMEIEEAQSYRPVLFFEKPVSFDGFQKIVEQICGLAVHRHS